MATNGWQSGPAPVGIVCQVWFHNLIMDAIFDGSMWRNTVTNQVLHGVTHWMLKTAG